MEVHDRSRSVSPYERSEDALMVRIHKEMEMMRDINRKERSLINIIKLKSSITRMRVLCEYGKEHLYTMTLRSINRIRMTENEIDDVSKEVHKCLSDKRQSDLLNIWEIGDR